MIEHMFDYKRRIEERIAGFDRLLAAENQQRLELLDEVAVADRDGF